jgi:tRNA(Ile)-lysidine synthase
VEPRNSLGELRHLLLRWFSQTGRSLPNADKPLAIAYSGGLDSTVLLHVAHSLWPEAVVAIHVNHGLQVAASEFEAQCVVTCQQLSVPLTVMRANIELQPGDSPEERARDARYFLLRQSAHAQCAGVLWMAQHADDQAETVLLALTRGAGVAGLAGMGEVTHHGDLTMGRPLLTVPQNRLRDLGLGQGWAYVDDPTNHDKRYTRNRIRHDVMPVLSQAFPQLVNTLARTSRHCAQADALLVDLARVDLLATGSPPSLRSLQSLSVARQTNALRCWLRDESGRAPSTAQLDELIKQVAAATTRGHRIDIKIGSGRVVRNGAQLVYVPPKLTAGKDGEYCGQNEA